MTGKATGTRLFPSCSAVEDNAFPPKNLHGLFGGVVCFAEHTPPDQIFRTTAPFDSDRSIDPVDPASDLSGCEAADRSTGGKSEPPGFQSEPPGFQSEPSGFHSEPSGFHSESSGFQSEPSGFQSEPSGFHSESSGFHSESSGFHSEPSGFHSGTDPVLSIHSLYINPK
jgi:cysteine protease ATG4/aarF domain-containing kinase